jgi:hypothetical protein
VFPQLGQIKLKCGNHSGPLKLGKVPQWLTTQQAWQPFGTQPF